MGKRKAGAGLITSKKKEEKGKNEKRRNTNLNMVR